MPGLSPCYQCKDRKAGCHGSCPLYLAWSEKRRGRNQSIAYHEASAIVGRSIVMKIKAKKKRKNWGWRDRIG